MKSEHRTNFFYKIRPELLGEWDYVKNNISWKEILDGSGKRVWWKCSSGHEWQAVIRDRIRDNSDCPYCSGRYASKENSLQTIFPNLAKEWNYSKNKLLTPHSVTSRSSKKAWWICDSGHEWQARVDDRRGGSLSCPYCSGQRTNNENCLATVNVQLAREWNYNKNGALTPKNFTGHSRKTVWWMCDKKHEWESTICSRANGNGCPYCVGVKVGIDNCLSAVNPKLAKQWHPVKNGSLKSNQVTANSSRKVWWMCDNKHQWSSTIASRNSGVGCPYCSGHRATKENCLAALNSDLAKEWHPSKNGKLTPYDITSHSGKKVWWKCSRGHEWFSTVSGRSKGNGCILCSGINLSDGAHCDSIPEAYYYLILKERNIRFKHHGLYGDPTMGKRKYDFYLIDENKYIEVTSFTKEWKRWVAYIKNIGIKRHFVERILKAKFDFIQLVLTPKQIKHVMANKK